MARIIFMGSPEIAVPSLKALLAAGHQIPLVVTQPDRPRGRGQKLGAPPIKQAAQALGLEVIQPAGVRDPGFAQTLREQNADGIAVVAYGRILPKQVLELTPLGCINLHFSLLPKYRGAACVPYALMNGDDETGVTTMQLDEGLDTGPILMQWTETIRADDTTETLSARLADLGAQQLVRTLAALEAGNLDPIPQDDTRASAAPLIKKELGHVDWRQPVQRIYQLYRGLTPWPGIFGFVGEKRILLNEIRPEPGPPSGPPGSLGLGPDQELWINAADGRLRVIRLQPEGKRILSAAEFVRGLKEKTGLIIK
jgi:methionyl-tRNA formyltransferase